MAIATAAADAVMPGLLHALLLDGSGGARTLNADELANFAVDREGVWLHLNFEAPEAADWLERSSGLNDVAQNALLTPHTRPRTINRGDNLLLTLRGLNPHTDADAADMRSLRIWTNGRCIISTERRRLDVTEALLGDFAAGEGPATTVDLLVALAEGVILPLGLTTEMLEDWVSMLEEQVLSQETEGLRGELANLRQQTVSLRRYLAPQRDAMSRLAGESVTWLDEIHRLRLREINDNLMRYVEGLDEVRERAAVAQEELITRVSEEMNQRSYIFTVVATIFLPLGFFTGLLGINVGGMPGATSDAAFWVVVAICGLLSGVVALWLRMRRWL